MRPPDRPQGPAEPPQRTAAALTYDSQDLAPRVVAKGRGELAEEIVRRAREAGVFVHESRELVSLLMQVDMDKHIPAQLYVAVAELLAWLHQMEKGAAAGPAPAPPRAALSSPLAPAPAPESPCRT